MLANYQTDMAGLTVTKATVFLVPYLDENDEPQVENDVGLCILFEIGPL